MLASPLTVLHPAATPLPPAPMTSSFQNSTSVDPTVPDLLSWAVPHATTQQKALEILPAPHVHQ